MTLSDEEVLAEMIAVTRQAGEATQRNFARFRNLAIDVKGPADFVSEADHEAELLIRERLLTRYPGWSLTGEEFEPVDG